MTSMGERYTFSLHHVREENGQLITQDNTPLDLTTFSRFKHGGGKEAQQYGFDMANAFEVVHPEVFTPDRELVVTASISKFLPLASDSLADAFANALNYSLHRKNLPPADRMKIHRAELVEGDYSALSESERK